MDESNDEGNPLGGVEAEIKELLGLFDVPAFARRGQDVVYALTRLRSRLKSQRSAMLDMVRLRLRQWAAVAPGSEADLRIFLASIAPLWPLGLLLATPSDRPRPHRQRRAVQSPMARPDRRARPGSDQSSGRWLQPLLPPRKRVQPRLSTARRPQLRPQGPRDSRRPPKRVPLASSSCAEVI
jgi:hypothetical protein